MILRHALAAAALSLLLWPLSAVAAADQAPALDHLDALIGQLQPAIVSTPASLEEALKIELSEGIGTKHFSFWTAGPVLINGVPVVRIEYRMPRPGGSATAGPMLIIQIDPQVCILMEVFLRTHARFKWDGAPSPHATDPDVYWAEKQSAATLSFGFRANGRQCLRTIVYSLHVPSNTVWP